MQNFTTEELNQIMLGLSQRYESCLDGIDVCKDPVYADSRAQWEALKATCESAYAKVQSHYLGRKDR